MQARNTSDGGTTALLGIYANNSDYITNTAISGTMMSTLWHSSSSSTQVSDYGIRTPFLSQTSLESQKKNFEKLKNGLDIIKNIDIYKYNLKSEENNTKKHIGFVIGDKYNYSKEITSAENDGADIYSFVSVCCKAIQEQQEEIEMLKDKISKLEKGEK